MKTVTDLNGNKLFNVIDGNFIVSEEQLLVDFIPDEPLTPEQIKANTIYEIKAKYEFHKLNGWDAYQEFRAMIVLDIAKGVITENQAFLIEKDLKAGYDRISQNGDWKTAYYELSQVTVSYPFIQPYMNIALSFILNYISENYDN